MDRHGIPEESEEVVLDASYHEVLHLCTGQGHISPDVLRREAEAVLHVAHEPEPLVPFCPSVNHNEITRSGVHLKSKRPWVRSNQEWLGLYAHDVAVPPKKDVQLFAM